MTDAAKLKEIIMGNEMSDIICLKHRVHFPANGECSFCKINREGISLSHSFDNPEHKSKYSTLSRAQALRMLIERADDIFTKLENVQKSIIVKEIE